MRKLIVLTFMSLDGVMQSPGAPKEDNSNGFKFGGWVVPYFDEQLGTEMGEQMDKPFDLLLGRKTFELFASYWPQHKEEGPGINNATKYVVSNTLKEHEWDKTVFINDDVVTKIKELKNSDGIDIQVHGSANLVQTLIQNDLVDEYWLKIFPLTIGEGKRIFEKGTIPAAFELLECKSTPSGVILAKYKRAGEIKFGSF